MEKIKVLFFEPEKLVRYALQLFLNGDNSLDVVTVRSPNEFLKLAASLQSAILLISADAYQEHLFDFLDTLVLHAPLSKLLLVSSRKDHSYIRRLVHTGIKGCLTRNCPINDIPKALHEIAAGRSYFCEDIKEILISMAVDLNPAYDKIKLLTTREVEIVKLIRFGKSSKEISEDLSITIKTVEAHRHNILKKLQVKNSARMLQLTHFSIA